MNVDDDSISSVLLAFQNQSTYIPSMCSKEPTPTLQPRSPEPYLLSSEVQQEREEETWQEGQKEQEEERHSLLVV